jgi:hypothetical protein
VLNPKLPIDILQALEYAASFKEHIGYVKPPPAGQRPSEESLFEKFKKANKLVPY